jgi:predicted alpha/beta superfamily hydrolase
MTACSDRASDLFVGDINADEMGAATLASTERFQVTAGGYAEPFVIDIAPPVMPAPPGTRHPVIYVLDGNWMFPTVAQTARSLVIGSDPIPQAIVVGIGYPFLDGPAAFAQVNTRRYRDLAPSLDDKHISEMRRVLPPTFWPQEEELGGADRFLRFIETQLKPFIERRYPVDTDDQTLVGVSLGGLFALRTLLSAPGSFDRYIAISPSIWWNACELHDLEDQAVMLGGVGGRLFLGVGGNEEDEGGPEARMVMNMVELAERMRHNFPGVQLSYRVFEEEGHMSVAPAGVSRGLRWVFSKYPDYRATTRA